MSNAPGPSRSNAAEFLSAYLQRSIVRAVEFAPGLDFRLETEDESEVAPALFRFDLGPLVLISRRPHLPTGEPYWPILCASLAETIPADVLTEYIDARREFEGVCAAADVPDADDDLDELAHTAIKRLHKVERAIRDHVRAFSIEHYRDCPVRSTLDECTCAPAPRIALLGAGITPVGWYYTNAQIVRLAIDAGVPVTGPNGDVTNLGQIVANPAHAPPSVNKRKEIVGFER